MPLDCSSVGTTLVSTEEHIDYFKQLLAAASYYLVDLLEAFCEERHMYLVRNFEQAGDLYMFAQTFCLVELELVALVFMEQCPFDL